MHLWLLSLVFFAQHTHSTISLNGDSYYSGYSEQFTVLPGKYKFSCYGAQGGSGFDDGSVASRGGYGAIVWGDLLLTKPTTFFAYIGGKGKESSAGGQPGGWNGGGRSGRDTGFGYNDGPGSGGGATDIRLIRDNVGSRVMVAAGGSGGAASCPGADGGDTTSRRRGEKNVLEYGSTTQNSGGSPDGIGQNGVDASDVPGSGGGGGWRGGAKREYSTINYYYSVADSGSSYISGHSGCARNPTLQFSNTQMTVGNIAASGNGKINIYTYYQCLSNCYECDNGVNCKKCAPNYYLSINQNQCLIYCPEGEYADSKTMKCTKCPIGTYSKGSVSQCSLCPKGTSNDQIGASSCSKCIGNYFAENEGQEKCTLCQDIGKGVDAEHKSCKECIQGTFSNKDTGYCQKCEEGYSAPPNSKSCMKCPPWTYSDSTTYSCLSCPTGYFSNEGSSGCTTCKEAHFWNNQTGQCEICPNGEGSTGKFSYCSKCEPGTYSNETSQHKCEKCPSRSFSGEGFTKCIVCEDGQIWNEETNQCKSCPSNTYSNKALTQCLDCPENAHSDPGSSKCNCSEGGNWNPNTRQCEKCLSGEYYIQLPTGPGECRTCSHKCQECSGSEDFCIFCYDTDNFFNNTCLNKCPDHYFSHDYSQKNNPNHLLECEECNSRRSKIRRTKSEFDRCAPLMGSAMGCIDLSVHHLQTFR